VADSGPLAATRAADPRLRRLRRGKRPEVAGLRARSPATLGHHPAEMSTHPHLLTGSDPVAEEDDPDASDTLRVVGWPDFVIDALGHDPRSWYVEQFWLSVLGPTNSQLKAIALA